MTIWPDKHVVGEGGSSVNMQGPFKHPTGGQCAHCGHPIVPGADTWPTEHHVFCKLACRASWLKWGRYL